VPILSAPRYETRWLGCPGRHRYPNYEFYDGRKYTGIVRYSRLSFVDNGGEHMSATAKKLDTENYRLTVIPQQPRIGAEIYGLDLSAPLTNELC